MNSEYIFNNFGLNEFNNSNKKNNNFFSEKEGYENGNIYMNLYEQYKNYIPQKLIPKNDKERLFYDYSAACFMAHELNLYLDVYPNNISIIQLFNDYKNKSNMLKQEYEKKYGVMCITSDELEKSPFVWVTEDFPWEGLV